MKQTFLVLICLPWFVSQLSAAGITLTQVPTGLSRSTTTITIMWQEPISAKLKFGTSSGQYSKESKASGIGKLTFTPQDEGMPPGVYYCIIAASNLTSAEFKILIESTLAATMQSPQNNSVLNTTSPTFRWDPVPGVPFYHLILSDREVVLREDVNGELVLQGGNMIWQAITPNTSIVYGEPDPSGFFAQFNAIPPPLMEGFEYNWVVLNNYNNHPAYSSTVQSGVSGFRLDLNLTITAPVQITPQANAAIADADILFSWSAVTKATAYQVLLSETREQDGSESSYLIWRPITTETSIELPARMLLRAGKYFWRVIAIDDAGRGARSETRDFTYNVPLGKLHIQTFKRNRTSLPRAEIIITPEDGSSETSRLITTDSGVLDNDVQPGTYKILASKEGYADTSATAKVQAGEVVNVNLTLRDLQQSISGLVVDQAGQKLQGVTVSLDEYTKGIHKATLSDAGGTFNIPLTSGNWFVYATMSGYSNSDTLSVALQYGEQKKLPANLKLTEKSARLTGKVTTASGIPILNAEVVGTKDGTSFSTSTDHNGLFTLDLLSGEWQVYAEKAGFIRSAARSITLSRGETLTLSPDLTLSANAALVTGFVQSEFKTIEGAWVQAIPLAGQTVAAISDPKGSFILSLPAGDYLLRASATNCIAQEELFIHLSEKQTISGVSLLMTQANAYIRGSVKNGSLPIQGVIVACEVASDTTNPDGSFQLAVLPGSHEVQAFHKGFLSPAMQKVQVGKGESKEGINFAMGNSAGVVEGSVTSAGKPVPLAWIKALAGTKQYQCKTGIDGSFWLTLPAGIWDLSAGKTGFEEKKLTGVALNAGQTVVGADFALLSTQSILAGTISDSKNRKIKSALIEVVGTGMVGTTDRFGNYGIALNPGRYQAIAKKTGYVQQESTFSLSTNETKILNLVLPIKAVVTGIISDPAARPLDKVQITAAGKDTLKAISDFAGEYTIFFTGGSYQLTADQLGYTANGFSFTANMGDTLRRNLTLTENPSEIAKISGKLLNSEAQPMTGVPIKIVSTETQIIYSDMYGAFASDILETGKAYTLQPMVSKRFFVPPQRTFNPLNANQANQNFVGGFYGDASGNELISSYDGSLVLRVKAEQDVAPYYKTMPRDSIAADVSGNREVSAFDASLIFRYSAGLIDKFPVDHTSLLKFEYNDSTARLLALEILEPSSEYINASLTIDNADELYSGEFTITYNEALLEFVSLSACEITRDAQLHHSDQQGRLKIAMASAAPLEGSGSLLQASFRLKSPGTAIAPLIRIAQAELDENLIPVKFATGAAQDISTFQLFENYPNPFNSSTVIRYALPTTRENAQTYQVDVAIYNVLGQRVRTLVSSQQPGGLHTIYWEADDDLGQKVPSGIYFYKIVAGRFEKSRKLLLIR